MRSEPVPNAISVNFFGQYAGFFRSKLVCTEIFPPIYRIIYSPKLHFVMQIALFMSYVQVLIIFFWFHQDSNLQPLVPEYPTLLTLQHMKLLQKNSKHWTNSVNLPNQTENEKFPFIYSYRYRIISEDKKVCKKNTCIWW